MGSLSRKESVEEKISKCTFNPPLLLLPLFFIQAN